MCKCVCILCARYSVESFHCITVTCVHTFQLSEELKMNIRPRANLTFAKCLEMKLDQHIETITKVSEVAGKEFSIEQVC